MFGIIDDKRETDNTFTSFSRTRRLSPCLTLVSPSVFVGYFNCTFCSIFVFDYSVYNIIRSYLVSYEVCIFNVYSRTLVYDTY